MHRLRRLCSRLPRFCYLRPDDLPEQWAEFTQKNAAFLRPLEPEPPPVFLSRDREGAAVNYRRYTADEVSVSHTRT